jgi:hypothetical protein
VLAHGVAGLPACEDAMNDTRHVRMKIGDAEFEADVPADSVQSMYDRFLAAVEKKPAVAPAGAGAPVNPAKPNEQRPPGAVDEAFLARVFELRPDGFVTLRALPRGEERDADAFLLILYAYRRLKNEERILGTQLLRSAELSGITNARPGDALNAHESLVIRSGLKKGRTYQLNNPGVVRAEEIAARIFD